MVVTLERDDLITENLNLVYSVAREMKNHLPKVVELEELIADGMVGLTLAAERFDPDRGNRFSTYAAWRIRGMILDGLRSRDVVGRRRNWDSDDIRLQPALRLDQPAPSLRYEADHGSLGDAIPDRRDAFVHWENQDLMHWVLDSLTRRERDVVIWMYWEDWTVGDIGRHLGVTEGRVSQIHTGALHKMRLAMQQADLGTASMNAELRRRLQMQRRKPDSAEERFLFKDLLSLWSE